MVTSRPAGCLVGLMALSRRVRGSSESVPLLDSAQGSGPL